MMSYQNNACFNIYTIYICNNHVRLQAKYTHSQKCSYTLTAITLPVAFKIHEYGYDHKCLTESHLAVGTGHWHWHAGGVSALPLDGVCSPFYYSYIYCIISSWMCMSVRTSSMGSTRGSILGQVLGRPGDKVPVSFGGRSGL